MGLFSLTWYMAWKEVFFDVVLLMQHRHVNDESKFIWVVAKYSISNN